MPHVSQQPPGSATKATNTRKYAQPVTNLKHSLQGDAKANSTAKTPEAPKTMVVEQERKRTIRVPLVVGGQGFLYPGLTAPQLMVSILIYYIILT